MRKLGLLASSLFLAGVLVGCGDNDEVTNIPGDVASNTAYKFSEFSLDVDYSATSSYEASFDNEQNKTEASIEDTPNNEKIYGNEALKKLDPLFKKLTFGADTPHEDVIAEVLKVFGLDTNYTNFELDVRFTDGTEKEYKHLK